MLSWTAWVALAWAGPWEDLATVATGRPDFAVTCSSAPEAWEALGKLLGAAGPAVPGDPTPPLPWAAGVALFEPDSRLALRFSGDEGALDVRFTTRATAEEVARRFVALASDGERSASLGSDGWQVRSLNGQLWRVAVADGWASLARQDQARAPGEGLPSALRQAIPDPQGGCLAWFHLEGKPPMGTVDLAAQFPLRHAAPIRFAAMGDALAPLDGVFFDPQPPIEVRSHRRPDGVLVLGVGLDGIDFSRVLEGRALRQIRAVQRLLPIRTGSVLAILPGEEEPMIAAVLPVRGDPPATTLARRVKRVLRAADIRAESIDATHMVVDLQGSVFHLATVDGRILISDDLPLIYDMAANTGEPWVTGALAERATRYPLVLSTTILPDPTAPKHLDPPFSLALDLYDGVVRGEVVLPLTMEELAELTRESVDRFGGPGAPDGAGEAEPAPSAGGDRGDEGSLEDPGPDAGP